MPITKLYVGSISSSGNLVNLAVVDADPKFMPPDNNWKALFDLVEQRVRHRYKHMVASPTTTSAPDKYQWKDEHGPYSRL